MIEAVLAGFVDKVHFADGAGGVTALAEEVRNGWDVGGEGVLQDLGAMAMGVLAGDERTAGGNADGRGAVGAGEANGAAGERVNVWRLDGVMTVAAAGGALVLVRHQEKQIELLAPG